MLINKRNLIRTNLLVFLEQNNNMDNLIINS